MGKISIVTVTYNNLIGLKKTIQSIENQSCRDFEYIIIDGLSNDGTREFIAEKKETLDHKLQHFLFISEIDNGIYDAMNKGTRYAGNDYVLFLNAGDTFYDKDVIEDIKTELNGVYDFIYGNTAYNNYGKQGQVSVVQPFPMEIFDTFSDYMPFCHQSVFIKREIMTDYQYDTKYKISADHAFFLKSYLSGCDFQYIPRTISLFEGGGISSIKVLERKKEVININYEFDRIDGFQRWKAMRKIEIKHCISKVTAYVKKLLLNISA